MEVGGEVVGGEAEPDLDVRVVETRERFESWAETFGLTAVDRDLVKVGEDHPFMESRLPMAPVRPDLYEPLTALMEPGSAEEWWERLVSTQEEGHETHSLEKQSIRRKNFKPNLQRRASSASANMVCLCLCSAVQSSKTARDHT